MAPVLVVSRLLASCFVHQFSASRPTENEIFSQFPMLAADSWKVQPAFCPLEMHLWPCCGDVCGWTVDYNQTLIKKDDFRLHMTLHRQQICSIWPYSECLDWWMDTWCNISNKRRCFRAPKPFFQPVFQDWCTQYSIFIWDSLNIILPTPVYAGCQTKNQEVVI